MEKFAKIKFSLSPGFMIMAYLQISKNCSNTFIQILIQIYLVISNQHTLIHLNNLYYQYIFVYIILTR